MLKPILVFALWFAFMHSNQAQQSADKIAQTAAKVLCKCLNEELKFLDKDVLDAFVQMLEMEKAAPGKGQEYILQMPASLQQKFLLQISQITTEENNMDECLDKSDIEKKIKEIKGDTSDIDQEKIMDMALEKMSQMGKKCDAVYKLLDAGLNGAFSNGDGSR